MKDRGTRADFLQPFVPTQKTVEETAIHVSRQAERTEAERTEAERTEAGGTDRHDRGPWRSKQESPMGARQPRRAGCVFRPVVREYRQPPEGGQSLVDRRRGRHPDVHGGARHDGAVTCAFTLPGGLSASVVDSEWVITSYLAANAIILPISRWLDLGSYWAAATISCFPSPFSPIASGLCGMATSLGQIIVFRALRGLAGGGLQPSSQGILIDSFPAEKQGSAMTLFGVAALLAPVVGPTLGGWITVQYEWRWIFYINVPVGLLALGACYLLAGEGARVSQSRTG